jgi:hypothetical protein
MPPSLPLAIPKPRKRFSELGISSFILGLLNVFSICLEGVLFGIFIVRYHDHTDRALAVILFLLFFLILIFAIVGLAIGLAGFFQPDRLWVPALFGFTINLIIVTAWALLLLILLLAPGSREPFKLLAAFMPAIF